MKAKFFLFLFLTLGFLGCKKTNPIFGSNEIKCRVVDYYTGDPIVDLGLSFDVASGSSSWTTQIERSKYVVISDSNGEFILKDLGQDIDNTFYPNFGYHSITMDSIYPEWRYFIKGQHSDSLWIVKGINTTLRLRPAAITYFHHPITENPNYTIDTIIINAYNQSDMITKANPVSESFHLLPSKEHQIEIRYIKNGSAVTKTISRYISHAFSEDSDPISYRRYDFNIVIPE